MKQVLNFFREINETNGLNEKKEILKGYVHNDLLTNIIIYALDPLKQYNVTRQGVVKFAKNPKYSDTPFFEYSDLFGLLDDLNSGKLSGHEGLKSINEFIKKSDLAEIIYNILDKNLKIRMNVTTINKVYTESGHGPIIKQFQPTLAKEYDPKYNKLNSKWYISRKLDGVRCLIHVNPHKESAIPYSRTGKRFYVNGVIKKLLDVLPFGRIHENVFLDGELVWLDQNGREDFAKTISIVRSQNPPDTDRLYYMVFDMIPEKEFRDTCGESLFMKRFEILTETFKKCAKGTFKIKVVEQLQYNVKNMELMKGRVDTLQWEGLMLRHDRPYRGKRIRDLAKIKEFYDEEFRVTDTLNGTMRIIDPKTKLEKEVEALSAVLIDYKDTRVGSGFSIEERQHYYERPQDIVGKMITVQYFEKTPDSLRFPVYKGIRDYE